MQSIFEKLLFHGLSESNNAKKCSVWEEPEVSGTRGKANKQLTSQPKKVGDTTTSRRLLISTNYSKIAKYVGSFLNPRK